MAGITQAGSLDELSRAARACACVGQTRDGTNLLYWDEDFGDFFSVDVFDDFDGFVEFANSAATQLTLKLIRI